MTTSSPSHFTPALGRSEFTHDYDKVIAVMTREHRWRTRLLAALNPAMGDIIVDLGSGTGSLAVLIARACDDLRVHAVDPDPAVRAIAEGKATDASLNIHFHTALGGDIIEGLAYGSVDKVVSSLVLHQCSQAAKLALLMNAYALLKAGGLLFIVDYGIQPTFLMQMLFNQVRSLDGYENTRLNKDGGIPVLIGQAGFGGVSENWVLQTPTGAITMWSAVKPSR